jgi:precorrin-2 dehydrogenase/sirohydrochlorin ferrochelatase
MAGREVLLIGAGRVGRRKLAVLLKAGAAVRVVEPKPDEGLLGMAAVGLVRLEASFDESFLSLRPIIIAAVDDPEEGRRLAALARGLGLLINVADQPADCDFHVSAVADLAPLRLAVTTEGASPALSAVIAAELRVRYRGHGLLASLLARLRPAILASGLPPERRRAMLLALASNPDLPALLAEGRAEEAKRALLDIIRPVEPPEDFWRP